MDPFDGILLIDKPSGITSHDVVARVRRAAKMRGVGHTGTLDPMATGLMIWSSPPTTIRGLDRMVSAARFG